MAKILIVDDSESFRRMHAEALKLDGHTVLMARNAHETWALVQSEHPDILLLDIKMPGADGYRICQKIKSDPETKDIKVVMVSSLSGRERFKSYQVGADMHVTKPVLSGKMRDMIRQLLVSKETRDNRYW